MGRVYKRGRKWYIDYSIGEGAYRTRIRKPAGNTKEQALKILTKLEEEKYFNRFGITSLIKISTRELFNNFIQLKQKHIAPSTWDTYEHRIAFWQKKHKEQFAPLPLIEIEHIVLEDLKHLANGTINSYINLLIQIYDYAIAHKHCRENPAKQIPKLKRKSQKKSRYLTKEEFERLLDYSPEFYKKLWIVLAYTGIRLNGIRLLKWIDIDMQKKLIYVGFRKDFTTKTGIKKIIPMHPRVERAIKDLEYISEYVFPTSNGKPFHKNSWLKSIKRYAKKARLENVNIHTLRHTFATWLALEGIPKDIRMTLLGHTDEKTTDIYTHFPIEHIKKAIDRLS